jgi:outer membrane receptor protein involved in Fe transport
MDDSEQYKVTSAVENLTDEEYRTVFRDNGLRGMYTLYGEPMTWNLTFTYNFE